jgi:hypothetical protein
MKIKGAYKGKPVALSDTELVCEAVRDAFAAAAPKQTTRLVYGIQVLKLDVTVGRSGMSNPKHNDPKTYIATGVVNYKLYMFAKDRLVNATPITFNIKFKEATDEYGLPDTKILSYKEEP